MCKVELKIRGQDYANYTNKIERNDRQPVCFLCLSFCVIRVSLDKTYISRIEKGTIEPGVGLFFRIMDALGLRVDIVRPLV